MLVYRSPVRRETAGALVAELRASLDAGYRELARDGAVPHARAVELLLAAGEFEAAAVDALLPDADDDTDTTRALRALSLATGRALARSWVHGPLTDAAVLDAIAAAVEALPIVQLPHALDVGVPEGYAYYALYPETYIDAARAFHAAARAPAEVVCVGLRGIGASLSAAVAAELERLGATVSAYTVRPRGHPFDRRLVLAPALAARMRGHAERGAHFAVVDEGPGISGTSFAAAVEALAALGVPESRVALFPSWDPPAERLRSERARRVWERATKFVGRFEDAWLESGRLTRAARTLGAPADGPVRDLSAGAWRALLYEDAREWPTVQPQHERRKYLLTPSAGTDAPGVPVLLEFAGLGRRGRAALDRARRLHAAGISPRPLGVADGFLATEWVGDAERAAVYEADDALLGAAARYLALRRRDFASSRPLPFDELREMMRVNVAEGCGDEWAERLAALDPLERAVRDGGRASELDGRMMPHEWLRAPGGGWLKTDVTDHGDDHFWPGAPLDVAWDVAGACVELGLDDARAATLVARYAAAAGDATVGERLPFYRIAYLAFRLGYVALGAEALGGGSSDAVRLRAQGRRYRALLERALLALTGELAPTLPVPHASARLVIFDADETLRRTTAGTQSCPHGPDEWELLPGVRDALRQVAWGEAGGIALGVASNQDHVGYGHLSERLARRLLTDMVVEATGVVPPREAVRLCPHRLDVACDCRKPAPGMLRAIVRQTGVAPHATLFVGNAESDAEAARRAGIRFAWAWEFFEMLRGVRGAWGAGTAARDVPGFPPRPTPHAPRSRTPPNAKPSPAP